MSLARVGKQFIAQNAPQLVTVVSQLLLPPTFLHAYGIALYGEWLALSAALGYLSSFNYGLQTYANMQMTIHYSRGEVQACREVQSGGLRILLTAFALILLFLLIVFIIPLKSLLHLTIQQSEASWTLYFLGCQVVANMLFGFLVGTYMVVGIAHRGTHAANLNQLIGILTVVSLALLRLPFEVLAGGQLCITLLFSCAVFLDLRRIAPDIRPSLRYWRRGMLGAMLKPSGQYALLYSSNILAYQVPLLLMQRIIGPAGVVMYTVTRTIYSMSRRFLNLVTNSIGPEITITYAQSAWRKLHRLYELSERIVLMITVPITFGSMLATPLLLRIWLHKPNLFDPMVCLTLGITASILGLKEHKYQFQFSTNRIQEISYATVLIYGAMILLSIPMMMRFGLIGFIVLWALAEIIQLFYLLHLNEKLFGSEAAVEWKPLFQMLALLAVGAAGASALLYHIKNFTYLMQAVLAIGVMITTGVISYRLFQVDEVREFLWRKISPRIPAFARRA